MMLLNKNQRARDLFVAENISQLQGNGWVSYGSAHQGIVTNLERICSRSFEIKAEQPSKKIPRVFLERRRDKPAR